MKSTVTYSPEDNKLRLYVGRVPRAEYEALRAAGFTSTPTQDCDFVTTWTPSREDLAAEYLEGGEDIGDEDYSPEERAADKAERFDGYRGKRLDEATGHADTFEAGPSAFGHQNHGRAERQAMRHDRHRVRAVSQWSKAEYWQTRTAAVIRHALHRSSASVRRGRILRLEAEQRKHESGRDEYAKRYAAWQKVTTLEGAAEDVARAPEGHYGADMSKTTPAGRLAYTLANASGCYGKYKHPRADREALLYSLLTDAADPITPAEAAALWLTGCRDPNDENTYSARASAHYVLRLTYERAMLAQEGGTAADAEMELGGFVGKHQIHKVNKSPATGRVVSVTLRLPGSRWGNSQEGHHMRVFNIERLPEGAYRAPTDEERAAFKGATIARKVEEKATTPPAPPLINPTDADADRLQAILNSQETAADRHNVPLRMTQAQYSALSKGTYAKCETVLISERLRILRTHYGDQQRSGRVGVFKVRAAADGWKARRVIVLTDKPQAAFPWRAVELAAARMPSEETHGRQLVEFFAARPTAGYEFGDLPEEERKRFQQLRRDFGYLAWMRIECANQCDLTKEGQAILTKWRAIVAAEAEAEAAEEAEEAGNAEFDESAEPIPACLLF